MTKILRTWTFWIRTALCDECRAYLDSQTLANIRVQPGNLRATALFRDLPDGTTEVVVASVWLSMKHIKDYTGPQVLAPAVDPAVVKAKMSDKDARVQHYAIDASIEELLLVNGRLDLLSSIAPLEPARPAATPML